MTNSKLCLTVKQLEDFIEKFDSRRQYYQVPGAALGIVMDGTSVVCEGFGKRNLAQDTDVDEQTLFALGSTTKSLTAFMVATQVEQKLYGWDTPVNNISSQYKFPPAFPERDIPTVRDLLGMNTGIDGALNPFANLDKKIYGVNATLWNDQSAIYTIKNIPHLPIETINYRKYKYSNELFATAGYLTPLKQSKPTSQLLPSYIQLMHDQVFEPIGMTSSRITGILSSASNNYAVSYGLDMSDNEPKVFEEGPISINYIDGISPAGQGVSNVVDMNRYLITLLNKGVNPDGKRLVKEKVLQELWNVEKKSLIDSRKDPGITGLSKYGMGLWVEEIQRKSNPNQPIKIYWHGGFLPSWSSLIILLPEKNIGMVILTNGCFGREFFVEMAQELIKLLYGDDLLLETFIDNEALYNKFLQNLKEVVPTKVSSNKVNPKDVDFLLGNYEAGWTLELDTENRLVLFKNGWIYHLYPSRENLSDKNLPLYKFYMGASNNHRGLKASSLNPDKPDADRWEGAKIWFVQDSSGTIKMFGAQIGEVKKLPIPKIPGEPSTLPLPLPQEEQVKIEISQKTADYLDRNLQLD